MDKIYHTIVLDCYKNIFVFNKIEDFNNNWLFFINHKRKVSGHSISVNYGKLRLAEFKSTIHILNLVS